MGGVKPEISLKSSSLTFVSYEGPVMFVLKSAAISTTVSSEYDSLV